MNSSAGAEAPPRWLETIGCGHGGTWNASTLRCDCPPGEGIVEDALHAALNHGDCRGILAAHNALVLVGLCINVAAIALLGSLALFRWRWSRDIKAIYILSVSCAAQVSLALCATTIYSLRAFGLLEAFFLVFARWLLEIMFFCLLSFYCSPLRRAIKAPEPDFWVGPVLKATASAIPLTILLFHGIAADFPVTLNLGVLYVVVAALIMSVLAYGEIRSIAVAVDEATPSAKGAARQAFFASQVRKLWLARRASLATAVLLAIVSCTYVVLWAGLGRVPYQSHVAELIVIQLDVTMCVVPAALLWPFRHGGDETLPSESGGEGSGAKPRLENGTGAGTATASGKVHTAGTPTKTARTDSLPIRPAIL